MSAEEIAHKFYRAFQARDGATMAACYAPDATFSDPVFPDLRGEAIGDMWVMLTSRGKDLDVTYEVVSSSGDSVVVTWDARYTFSKTGRKVLNQVRSELTLKGDKIVRQKDTFNFYKWSRQALGFAGLLLGWTPMLQGKVQSTAGADLQKYRERKASN
ncbi:MAG: nuclear transport factor 2 family protein [Polyangiaceae bacterium]